MQITPARSQKSKVTPKRASGRAIVAAPTPSKGNSKNCPAAVPSISAEERQNLIARAAVLSR